MSDQTTFASLAWTGKKKVTRRKRFLAEMEAAIPWARLVALVAPHYPVSGRGRPSILSRARERPDGQPSTRGGRREGAGFGRSRSQLLV